LLSILTTTTNFSHSQEKDTVKLFAQDFDGLALQKPPKDLDITFNIPNEICKSGNCKVIAKDFWTPTLSSNNLLFINGYFQIKDDITNKDLTSKKRDLVESFQMSSYVDIVDIKEDLENKITTYFFEGPITFKNDMNNKAYNYDIKGSYVEPSEKLYFIGEKDNKLWGY
jgi:hypothetical protein